MSKRLGGYLSQSVEDSIRLEGGTGVFFVCGVVVKQTRTKKPPTEARWAVGRLDRQYLHHWFVSAGVFVEAGDQQHRVALLREPDLGVDGFA